MSSPRVVVLASGAGSLFRSLIDARASLGIDIVGLISDAHVPAVDIARSFDVPAFVIPVGSDRAQWNSDLSAQLRLLTPDLIVSAGFMRVLGPTVVDEFEGRIDPKTDAFKFNDAYWLEEDPSVNKIVIVNTSNFYEKKKE